MYLFINICKIIMFARADYTWVIEPTYICYMAERTIYVDPYS